MKKILLILVVIVIAIGFFKIKKPEEKIDSLKSPTLTINNKTIAVEIADTTAKRRLGLSGRESLAPGTGLLFVFDEPDYHSFWMKEMNFPIDIFWLDENHQIVDSWLNAPPDSFPEARTSKVPAKYVLETNPGELLGL